MSNLFSLNFKIGKKKLSVSNFGWIERVLVADLTVTVGQLSLIYEDVGEETFPVRKVIIHPDFNSTTLKNNLALLEVNLNVIKLIFKSIIVVFPVN